MKYLTFPALFWFIGASFSNEWPEQQRLMAVDHNASRSDHLTFTPPSSARNVKRPIAITINRPNRVKRAAGTTLDQVLYDMTDHTGLGDLGDSFDFQVTVDLPLISEATTIKMEIFAIDPTTGLGGFTICSASEKIASRGSNVPAVAVVPEPQAIFDRNSEHPNVKEKAYLQWEGVQTTAEDEGDLNKIVVDFNAMMVPLPQVSAGQKYYVSAGIEYNDESYVWIAQSEITASLTGKIYNASVAVAESSTFTNTMKKGQGGFIQIDAFFTEPMSDIKVTAAQPLGYTDVFHIGQITATTGSAYGCSDPDLWMGEPQLSLSGVSNIKYTLMYPGLINNFPTRDETKEENKIVFKIPIHVLNSEHVVEGLTRDLSLGIMVGDRTLWAAVDTITISGVEEIPEEPATPTTVTAELLTSDVIAGDGALYSVTVTAPSGWVDFNIEVEGGDKYFAASVQVINAGTVSYFPMTHFVTEKDGDILKVNFGPVFNAAEEDTQVILKVAFNTATDVGDGEKEITKLTVGGTAAAEPLPKFNVIPNSSPTQVQVSMNSFGIIQELMSGYIHPGGQVAFEMFVNVPSGSATDELILEAVPDALTTFPLRICKTMIYQVGSNLPCMQAIEDMNHLIQYNKSAQAGDFNDFAKFPVGPTCPVNLESPHSDANAFHALIIYELPVRTTAPKDSSVVVNGGVRVGGDASEAMWVSSATFKAETLPYEGPVKSVSGYIIPFFTDYPFVTNMDRPDDTPVVLNEPFFIKYILKPQPRSIGKYLITFKPGANFKICKLLVTHVGENFPCAHMDEDIAVEDKTSVWGYVGDDFTQGTNVALSFHSLVNYGEEPITTDLIADEDSIQVVVFYQYLGSETNTIDWLLNYGDASLSGSSTIATSAASQLALTTDKAITFEEYHAKIGANDKVNKQLPKLLSFKFRVPSGFHNSFEFSIENKDFDDPDKQVDFCSVAIVFAGNNLPCIHAFDNATTTRTLHNDALNKKVVKDEEVYKKMSLTVGDICTAAYSNLPEDNMLYIEVALRVKDYVANDATITLKASINDHTDAPWTDDYTFTVADFDETLVTTNIVQAKDIKITVPEANLYGVSLGVGDKTWLPFTIEIPPSITSLMEISFVMPSIDGRPVVHATDVKFTHCKGFNVLCVEPHVDLRRNYQDVFSQTTNITTFMSTDQVKINLGYVINAGYSKRFGDYKTEHDQLAVMLEVQMSDHPITQINYVAEVNMGVKMGETVATSSQKLNVTRAAVSVTDRQTIERGNIVVDVSHTLTDETVFNETNQIQVEAVVYHGEGSKAEGSPAKIRVIYPKFLKYVPDSDTFQTNFTQAEVTGKVQLNNDATVGITDFEFDGGILFPDIISLNFTLTVGERPVGAGDLQTAIIVHPICRQSIFAEWPADTSTYVGCGSIYAAPFISSSPECYDEITFPHECQVTASSQMDENSRPFNALSEDAVWSPALRTGSGWQEYLLFDFGVTTRINRIKVETPPPGEVDGKTYIGVDKIQIEMTNSLPYFNFVKKQGLPADKEVTLDQAVEARYAKVIIFPKQDQDPATTAIGVYKVVWYGCLRGEQESLDCATFNDPTVLSTSNTKYRHFAVDTTSSPVTKKIIYFCDFNPYREGMFCYCTDRLSGKLNTWSELPRYIGYIVGFSAKTGRMYFADKSGQSIMSSYNCKDVELTSTSALPDDIQAAVNVPGKATTDVTDQEWPDEPTIKGNFDGLWDSGKLLAKWRSCCEPSA